MTTTPSEGGSRGRWCEPLRARWWCRRWSRVGRVTAVPTAVPTADVRPSDDLGGSFDAGSPSSVGTDDGGADSGASTGGEGLADGGSNPGGHDGGADGSAADDEGPADGGSNPAGRRWRGRFRLSRSDMSTSNVRRAASSRPALRRCIAIEPDAFAEGTGAVVLADHVRRAWRGLRRPAYARPVRRVAVPPRPAHAILALSEDGKVVDASRFTRSGARAPRSPTSWPTTSCSDCSSTAPRLCCKDCTAWPP